jgi:hypothetical protein
MDTPTDLTHRGIMQTLTQAPSDAIRPADPRYAAQVARAIRRRSFGILSTVSAAGRPHAAGVVYDAVDHPDGLRLYVNTFRDSRKARNVAANGPVAFVIPVRRVPVGPPFSIQFQGRASIVDMHSAEITDLVARKLLENTAAHGALDEADGCFIRIEPTGRIHTYGLGVSTIAVARDPLHAGGRSFDLDR